MSGSDTARTSPAAGSSPTSSRTTIARSQLVSSTSADVRTQVDGLVELAVRGLPDMFRPLTSEFAQTLRGVRGPGGTQRRAEGTSVRYTAIAALGLAQVPEETQRLVLAGGTARDLAAATVRQARGHANPGVLALAAWAGAEVGGVADEALFAQLAALLTSAAPLTTVEVAWALAAAIAAPGLGAGSPVARAARDRLLAAQGVHGIFPHALPADSLGRWRAHVACFADQVYPIQALARLAAATGDDEALAAANRCAAQICALQGDAGQWWWHYDVREQVVVEAYPVYSVHQHAMAPMALLDLHEAGGTDHRDAVVAGLGWLETHPEVIEELVSERNAVVWRKVGRREPRKAVRSLAAVTTAVSPGWHLPGVARAFAATKVDYECRPYELGWLLYAWLSGGVVADLAGTGEARRG